MQLAILGRVNIATQLDKGYRVSIQKHNEQVDKNRYSLSLLIDCIKFCGAFELALRGHEETDSSANPSVFLGLVNFVSLLDEAMKHHLQNATVFKGTSKTIQNELLECMLEVCTDEITKEIKAAEFLAIMADETTNVSETMQMVIVFCYVVGEKLSRDFGVFLNPKGRDAETLSASILKEIEPLVENNPKKLIAQSYDGAAVMSGKRGGVQAKVRERYPHAYFVHCYAHQLNLIMEQAASQNESVRVFSANITGIPAFFSRSFDRLEALDEVVAKRIPGEVVTRWNLKIRIVNVIYENRDSLLTCFETIQERSKQSTTIREATGLRTFLSDPHFMFWLSLFHKIMPYVDLDILYNQLQNRQIDPVKVQKAVDSFKGSMARIRDNIEAVEEDVEEILGVEYTGVRRNAASASEGDRNNAQAKEIIDVITVQANDHLEFSNHLSVAKLLMPEKFIMYSQSFPINELYTAVATYPMLDKARLKTELSVLYDGVEFHSVDGSVALLQLFLNNNVQQTFSETVKLLKILITTPMTTAEPERCFSTLKRVKTFLRNTMDQERLNALAMLSIEKTLVTRMRDFNSKVIEKFASKKNRRMDFLYKQ